MRQIITIVGVTILVAVGLGAAVFYYLGHVPFESDKSYEARCRAAGGEFVNPGGGTTVYCIHNGFLVDPDKR